MTVEPGKHPYPGGVNFFVCIVAAQVIKPIVIGLQTDAHRL